MAAVKAKKPVTKLKAGQKKQVNKWLIVGGVAVVAMIGAVVVRYSGASGEVWSINSRAVTHKGGVIKQKDNGYSYWLGTKRGEYIAFTAPSAGTYCLEGKFLTKNMTVSIGTSDGMGHGKGGSSNVGSQSDYSICPYIDKGYQAVIGIESNGSMVFNRVRKK